MLTLTRTDSLKPPVGISLKSEADLRSEMLNDLALESCGQCGGHPEIDGHKEECPTWEEE